MVSNPGTNEAGGAEGARRRGTPFRIAVALGAWVYCIAQVLIAGAAAPWLALHWQWGTCLVVILLSAVFLAVVALWPRPFSHEALRRVTSSAGWPLALASAVIAAREPYVFIRDSGWHGPGETVGALQPFFALALGLIFFFAVFAHAVWPGAWRRWALLLDLPFLALAGLVAALHLHGYPEFQG